MIACAYRFEDPFLSGVPVLPLPPQLLHVLRKYECLWDKVTLLRKGARQEVRRGVRVERGGDAV